MFYIVLFGVCILSKADSPDNQFGQNLNIGWTIGEEILFKNEKTKQ